VSQLILKIQKLDNRQDKKKRKICDKLEEKKKYLIDSANSFKSGNKIKQRNNRQYFSNFRM
jgi:hypothetical protein